LHSACTCQPTVFGPLISEFVRGFPAAKKIDDCPLRNEYMSQILSQFFLPTLQFIFTVYPLGPHLEELDSISLRSQRKWLKLPNSATRPVMTSSVFNLGFVSLVAERSKAGSHARMREKANERVQAVLDAKLERESHHKRRSQQPTVRAEDDHQEAKCANPDKSAKAIVLAVRKQVTAAHDEKCGERLKSLVVQGKFTEVMDFKVTIVSTRRSCMTSRRAS